MNEQQRAEIQRIKSILSSVTGFEDDDQEYIEDARKALCRVLDQSGSEPVQALRMAVQDVIKGGTGIMLDGKRIDPASIYAEPKIGCVNHDCAQPAPVQEPVFWYRPVGEDGGYEGPLHNGVIEKVRKESGAWIPLVPATTPPAAQPAVPLTDEMVVRAARELCKIHAGECQVDEQDTWNLYADQFKRDARAALEAAHGITKGQP
jgi:hypothetical protein